MTDKEQEIRIEILPRLGTLVNHLWDNERGVEGRALDRIVDDLVNLLEETHVTPKVAYIEYSAFLDDFLEEWYDSNDEPPTQEEYDKWVVSSFWGFIDNHRHELDNYIKLKRTDD